MSYYGYPNAQAYSANYAQYAAAYAAQSGTYDQYQAAAAYNQAAYTAMQQNQQTPQANKPAGISVSGGPQRYDNYGQQNQAPTNTYDANTYSQGTVKPVGHAGPKWGQLPGQPGAPKVNKFGGGGGGGGYQGGQGGGGQFQGNRGVRRNPTGAPVQVFYCEVCKISCAGPQTYKEHLEGQKHKKKESINNPTIPTGVNPVTKSPTNTTNVNPRFANMNRRLPNPNRTPTSSNLVIQCALCDVACTGKDAYSAHVRGAKHQKTIKLHQKLGKPIPADATEMLTSPGAQKLNPNQMSKSQPGVIQAAPQINRSIGPVDPNMPVKTGIAGPMLVQGGQVIMGSAMSEMASSVACNVGPTEMHRTIVNEIQENTEEEMLSIEPVGKEYIETKQEGKIISFFCKLCDCQFNDPNAKDMHTKGRRHRLAYKKKVDPSLRVDMKGDNKMKDRKRSLDGGQSAIGQKVPKLMGGMIKPLMSGPGGSSDISGIQQLMSTQFNQYGQHQGQTGGNVSTFDDKHIIAKHNLIYPSTDEITAIQEIVSCTEKALKLVSDQISTEDAAKSEPSEPPKPEDTTQVQYRALKGVMRVGLLAKGLLLKDDTDVQLIVLCAAIPTKTLLERVYTILREKIDQVSPEIKYSIILDKVAETIVLIKTSISDLQPLITCKILLTSPLVRADQDIAVVIGEAESSDKSMNPVTDSADLLDKQRCLDSLAPLRAAKWFQARAANVPNCVVIIRVLRDLCQRNPTWAPLSQWGLELLVEKCLSSSTSQISVGEGFRRVLECVSSGILLPDGPGLYDPCEKVPTDVCDCLSSQQREELTSSAQMALRLFAFKQVFKILGIECLSFPSTYLGNHQGKKRHNVDDSRTIEETKKPKEDTPVTTETVVTDIIVKQETIPSQSQ